MSEQKLQKKIIDWLAKKDYYVVKTITCNRKGVPDILACSPSGQFVGIEVKYGANTASELQKYNLAEIEKRGGTAILAWDLETVIARLTKLA